MSPAITVRGLRVARGGREVLHGIDLDVEPGSVTGLLGPSGSGKTTLLRSIVGAQIVADGSVSVLGLPAGAPALRARVGYQTQAPSVYADLTVLENLDYFARILDVERPAVAEAVRLVDMGGLEGQLAATLSGGELARLSLAAALVNQPEIVVLDEPTVGLDPVLRQSLWQTFHDLAGRGTTLVVSSHVMDEASRCDALALLRDGRVLATGTPASLLEQTGTDDLDAAFLALVDEAAGDGR
ncbi:MAG TPA: ABC transporter ATP-binding protein [Gaiellaceae bacterium]|nr:ABC transporter ATP-binding protein [Gaiellaceae bacterium]